MDRNKIEYLKEKQRLLQKEVRLKQLRKRIAPKLNYMEEHSFAFKVFYDFKYINWINDNIKVRPKDGYRGSHGDFQIDVDDLNVVNTKIASKDDFLTVGPIAEFFNRISNETTLIICALGGDPELGISKEAFLSNPSLFFSSPETWVLSADKTSIIENILEQGVLRFIDITQSEPILRVKSIINY